MLGLNYRTVTAKSSDVSRIQALQLKDTYSQLKHAMLASLAVHQFCIGGGSHHR